MYNCSLKLWNVMMNLSHCIENNPKILDFIILCVDDHLVRLEHPLT